MVKVGFPKQIPGISNVKIGRFERNAAGDQAITGVGFVPKVVIFLAHATGGARQVSSWGFDDGTEHRCKYFLGTSEDAGEETAKSISLLVDATHFIDGYIKSMDSDGFTVTWAKTGAIIGYVVYLAMR